MNPEDFIRLNIRSSLLNEGFSTYISENCSRQAVRDWKRSTGSKGSMFNELLVKAKKSANQMKKALK